MSDTRKGNGLTGTRRDLLKLAAAGVPAAAATVLASAPAAAKEAPTSLGMTKTEHVQKYLDSARF